MVHHYHFNRLHSFIEGKLHEINVKWNPLDTTSFKLNTDVSFIEHSSLSSCEGLIRNFMGCFIRGFTCNLGRFTLVIAELWGLVHGLRLACNLGINFFIVEMDSLTVVGMVKSRKSQNQNLLPLLQEALDLMNRYHGKCEIKHVYYEANC